MQRVIYTNVLGICERSSRHLWQVEQGDYRQWVTISSEVRSTASGHSRVSTHTTLRLPWLNDRDVKYQLTHRDETYVGVSGSRKSVADVVLKIIADPDYLKNDSVGIADPCNTAGSDRPVY